MERRSVLKILGLAGLAACTPKDSSGSFPIDNRYEVTQEELDEVAAVSSVALRDSMDANIVLAKIYGFDVKQENYRKMLVRAIEAVKNGADPWAEDFWRQVNKKPNQPDVSFPEALIQNKYGI